MAFNGAISGLVWLSVGLGQTGRLTHSCHREHSISRADPGMTSAGVEQLPDLRDADPELSRHCAGLDTRLEGRPDGVHLRSRY